MDITPRRGGRVAEGGGLLNRCTVKSCTQGSNPCLSASRSPSRFLVRLHPAYSTCSPAAAPWLPNCLRAGQALCSLPSAFLALLPTAFRRLPSAFRCPPPGERRGR